MQLLQTVTMSRGKTLKGKCSVRKSRSISFLPSKYTTIERGSLMCNSPGVIHDETKNDSSIIGA